MCLLAAAVLAATLSAEGIDKLLLRLKEEAEAFARLAPRVIGEERLEQLVLEGPARFRPRGASPKLKYRKREIVSEYGFSTFQEDPGNLHELRQVVLVDGRPVKAAGSLREALLMGLRTETDRLKKKLLREFESYGLRHAAADFGQIVLLFTQSQMANYKFSLLRKDSLGDDRVQVVAYEQKDGDTAMTVFEGKQVVRHKLKGEVWLRANDGLPLRITMHAMRMDKNGTLRHEAVVDYRQSAYGALLPSEVIYREMVGDLLMVENRFRYSGFKAFGASSEVKFVAEENPPQ